MSHCSGADPILPNPPPVCVDCVRSLPPTDDLTQLCDIFTYTTMISQCNSHHQLRRAMELVAEMRSRAIPLNVHTYSALLNVCLKANELELSLDVYSRMLGEGVTPNLVTYNTLLDIYNKMGRWMDALHVLELLQHQVRWCLRGSGSCWLCSIGRWDWGKETAARWVGSGRLWKQWPAVGAFISSTQSSGGGCWIAGVAE